MALRPDKALSGMKAVPGVTDVTGSGRNSPADHTVQYDFSARLADDPSADTIVGFVAAYHDGLTSLRTQGTEQYSELHVSWKQGSAHRTLWLTTSDDLRMPDETYLRGMATWPTSLNLSASANDGLFGIHLAGDDATFRSDLAGMVAAGLTADSFEAYSTRYSVSWDDDPPLELFVRAAAVAPDATRVSIGSSAPQPNKDTDGWVQVTWFDKSATPASDAAASVVGQMHAVTDIWAGVAKPLELSLMFGGTSQVELNNTRCPSDSAPRNAEFWTYATRVGHRVVRAPSSC